MSLAKRLIKVLSDELEKFSDDELRALKQECHELTLFDWPEYPMRDMLWELADREKKYRKEKP